MASARRAAGHIDFCRSPIRVGSALRGPSDPPDRDTSVPPNGTLDERLYALQDANWNVTALAGTGGGIVERYLYDAYGTPAVLTGVFASRTASDYDWEYLFTGRQHDLETGLNYHRRRYLHPTCGVFCTRDPLGYEGSQWNLFQYADNQPVKQFDPTGENPVCYFVYNAAAGSVCMAYATIFEREKGGPYAPENDPGNHKTHCFLNCCMTMANLGIPVILPPMNIKEVIELPAGGLDDCAGDCRANFNGCCKALEELFGPNSSSCYQRCAGVPFTPRPKPKPPRPFKDPWPKSRYPCFEGNTKVLTAEGEKQIRDIRVGDLVVGFNVELMRTEFTRVIKCLEHTNGPFLLNRIRFGLEDVWVTDGHPVFDGNQWVVSHELDTECLTVRGNTIAAHVERSSATVGRVFNLVTENGTYAVGRSGLIVSGKVQRDDRADSK